MQATTHASHPVVQRGQQQAATPSAREPEGRQPVCVDARLTRQDVQRHQIIGQHGPGQGLPECPGRLGQRCPREVRRRGRTVRPGWGSDSAPATRPRTRRAVAARRGSGVGQIEPAAAPRERVVDQHGEAPARQLVGGGAARVPTLAQLRRPRLGALPELDQLLTADRPHTAMAVHAQHPGEIPGHSGRAQQPSGGVRPVADGPAQPTNVHPVQVCRASSATLGNGGPLTQPQHRRPARWRRRWGRRTAGRRVRPPASLHIRRWDSGTWCSAGAATPALLRSPRRLQGWPCGVRGRLQPQTLSCKTVRKRFHAGVARHGMGTP